MIIVFDGPEKAGKTTTIAAVADALLKQGHAVRIRKWGPAVVDDREYAPALAADSVADGFVTLWDRSWVSEHVYASMLNRDRRLRSDPWLGEWFHRRAVDACGLHYIMLPQDVNELGTRRDNTDLPVSPLEEALRFEAYAKRFAWPVVRTIYTPENLAHNVERIIADVQQVHTEVPLPPGTCGQPLVPSSRGIVFVGESLSRHPGIPGAWLPFTSGYTVKFARMLGDGALAATWTNSDTADQAAIGEAAEIVCVGGTALRWVEREVKPKSWQKVTILPHPAYAFRWNTEGGTAAYAEMLQKMGDLSQRLAGRWQDVQVEAQSR